MIGDSRTRPTVASDDVDARFAASSTRRLSKTLREDQPARPQVLDRDLARVLLVDRREVIERHAAVELHLEQLVHRQLAARVGQADDDAIDAARADDRRNVLDRADHAGIDHRLPDHGGVGIDEADDADAEFVAALVQLPGERDGRRRWCPRAAAARAAPCAVPSQSKTQPPADDERDHEEGGDHEDAAAENHGRETRSRAPPG